jgi:hypothetical protein
MAKPRKNSAAVTATQQHEVQRKKKMYSWSMVGNTSWGHPERKGLTKS